MDVMTFLVAAMLVILVLLFITVSGNLNSTGRAVERLERKLDLVIEHLGIEESVAIPPDVLAEIDRCLWSDRRREATMLYRETTGHGAAEAKAWIDRRAAAKP